MAINPNISLAVRGIELQDPLAQYGRVAAIQGAQQQNQLAQLQMQQVQREQESTNALNRAYAEAYNPQTGEVDVNKLRGSLSTGGFGSKLPALEKSLGELAQQKLTQEKLRGEVTAQPVKLAADKVKLLDDKLKQQRSFLDTLDPTDPSAPARYMQWHEANHADPDIGAALTARGITVDQSRNQILRSIAAGPQAFANMINASKLGTEKFMEMNKPVTTAQDTGAGGRLISRPGLGGAATIVAGSQFTKDMAPGEAERLKNEGRRIGLEGRRVAVLEENARRDADPVFQQRMGAARATGEAIAKGDVAAMQALPKVIGDAELAVGLLDQMVGKRDSKTGKLLTKDPVTGEPIQNNKPHPGFKPAVGMGGFGTLGIPGIAQLTPGTDAANFKTLYDQVMGAAFSEAFETLKGGGAITEKEGTKATAARNRMSLAQSEDEFVKAALEYRDIVAKGVERAQSKAARATGRMAPTAPAAGGGIKFLGFE